MAGSRDKPEDRAARDEALAPVPPPGDDPDRRTALEASAVPVLSPRGAAVRVLPIAASGARVDLSNRRQIAALRSRRQAWQSEAWAYFKEVPEFAYGCMLTGALMSKVRLFAAVRTDAQDAPVAVDDENSGVDATDAKIAIDALARLRSNQGGQRALIRLAAINMDVVAECYLHGHTDADGGEDWSIRSVHELVVEGDRYQRRIGPGGRNLEDVPDGDVVIRLWDADPEFSEMSYCLTRSALAELEALLLLSREVRSTAKCADEQTRIMTADGWVNHQDLTAGDLVLTLDHETGLSHWEPVLAVNRYDRADEPMMLIDQQGHSSLTTLNHRWPVLHRANGTRTRRWRESRQLSAKDTIPCAAPCADLPTEPKYSDAFVELVAWFWTEGYTRDGQIEITQSERVNEAKCARIRAALTALYGPARAELRTGMAFPSRQRRASCSFLGCEWPAHGHGLCDAHRGQARRGIPLRAVRRSTTPPDRALRTSIPGWREDYHEPNGCTVFRLNQPAAEPLLAVAPDKIVRLGFIRSLTAAQLALFIDVSWAADGHVDRNGSRSILQNEPARLDALELACILSGLRVNRTPAEVVLDGRVFPLERLTIWKKTTVNVGPSGPGSGRRKGDTVDLGYRNLGYRNVVPYTGVVWCPTTASGTWLAERNGSVYWTGNSRALRGILLYPQELTLGPPNPAAADDDDAEADPFVARLMEAITTAIADEGSAAAMAPIVLGGAAEFLKEVRLVSLASPMDGTLDARIEARIMRLARGMNWPVETITGLQATTFANAASIERHEFDAHLEPRCVTLCDALTSGYYRDALEEAGVSREQAERIFIWFDPSELIAVPDQAEQAMSAVEKLLISGAAGRQYLGYPEADAPTPAEMLLRVLIDSARRMDPFIQGQLLVQLGLVESLELPSPASGTTAADEPSVLPDLAAALAASARPRSRAKAAQRLGRRLAGIDRDLRTRLRVAAEASMRRALEKAGARVERAVGRAKGERASAAREAVAGVSPRMMPAVLGRAVTVALTAAGGDLLDGAFDDFINEFQARVDTATLQALAEVEDYLGEPLSAAARTEFVQRARTGLDAATDWIHGRLRDLAGRRLYDTTPGVAEIGEADVSFVIPEGLIRSAVALAGGGSETPEPGMGGVATGPLVMNEVTGDGTSVEAYVWDYGTVPRAPFDPHLDLDGVTFQGFDDEVLLNDTGWPDSYCYAGDHEGCCCSIIPVLVAPDDTVTPEVSGEADG